MRLSAKVQGAARKTAAKSRASLAPVPPDIVVGCRVLVKAVEGEDPLPGLVLFIGETQFAAGTWLGVELDDPKGKNDGTVQGVSYFNARVNHGLFVRAVKVQKIEDKEATGRPTLPAPSSPAQKMPKAFAVGDRVLVRPAENSPGTVRFAGQTKFAEGEWFGVELEKPLGKN
ncbi:CAP-Gly domain-containing linker protein 2 (Cytoplasmic linker protein 115) (CLIP-115) (Cytoplasmic linker protein 2), partial [Durusdinium trenchii]